MVISGELYYGAALITMVISADCAGKLSSLIFRALSNLGDEEDEGEFRDVLTKLHAALNN